MEEEQKTVKFRPLRSLTRLLIGGILLGSEVLDNQLQHWDSNGVKAAPTNQNHTADEFFTRNVACPPGWAANQRQLI